MPTYLPHPRYSRYLIGDNGSVFGLKGKVLKTRHDKRGRVIVSLCPDGKNVLTRVSLLVCETFHAPRPAGLDAAHNDGDLENNAASNLRWATRKENMADTIKHGTHLHGQTMPLAKLTDDSVRYIRFMHALKLMSAQELADKYGVHFTVIHKALSRETWRHI